ncbi:hypothetical protein AGMMS49991_07710 [Spirochaetia bacterium]|nr:hypothetical protein AGMMS49991_07710 [Spirochaetia bacterium]
MQVRYLSDAFISSPSSDTYQGLNYVVGAESKEPHHIPHVHVYKRMTRLATLDFNGNPIPGTDNNLTPDQLRKALTWVHKNHGILVRDWNELNPDNQFIHNPPVDTYFSIPHPIY